MYSFDWQWCLYSYYWIHFSQRGKKSFVNALRSSKAFCSLEFFVPGCFSLVRNFFFSNLPYTTLEIEFCRLTHGALHNVEGNGIELIMLTSHAEVPTYRSCQRCLNRSGNLLHERDHFTQKTSKTLLSIKCSKWKPQGKCGSEI